MRIGYARVSTDDQNLDLQRQALMAVGCETIFEDRLSGASLARPGLADALAALKPGDVLAVWRLDRLGRSLADLIELLDTIGRAGSGFQSLSDSIDTTTAGGRLVFHLLGAMAEFERGLIAERTKAGLSAARKRGQVLGRPRKLTFHQLEHARALIDAGQETRGAVAALFNVDERTLRRSLTRTAPSSKVRSMKTISESTFEKFLTGNNLRFNRIAETTEPRPDYAVHIADDLTLIFEVKELSEDGNFTVEAGIRTVGDHIRKKISGARKQMKFGAAQGKPSILLIYNDLDYMHMFGTENHDFETAMYGEYTLLLDKTTRKIVDSFNGRNKSVADAKNTSFSALGRLMPVGRERTLTVTLFENIFGKIPVPYDRLPPCFEVIRVTVDESPLVGRGQ